MSSISEKYVGFRTMYFSLFEEIKKEVDARENGAHSVSEFYSEIKRIIEKYEHNNFLP